MAVDQKGQVSSAATAADTADPPPPPPADSWASKGNHVNVTGCSSSACAHVNVNTSNFPAGTYSYTCVGDGNGYYSNSMFFPANGTVETPCVWGYPGTQVYVQIHGVMDTRPTTW